MIMSQQEEGVKRQTRVWLMHRKDNREAVKHTLGYHKNPSGVVKDWENRVRGSQYGVGCTLNRLKEEEGARFDARCGWWDRI